MFFAESDVGDGTMNAMTSIHPNLTGTLIVRAR
jgi:hypothetical protein